MPLKCHIEEYGHLGGPLRKKGGILEAEKLKAKAAPNVTLGYPPRSPIDAA
jgi:hypothetical protein